MKKFSKLILYTDGASKGNPGPAGIGVAIKTPDGNTIEVIAESIGQATNNVAEYRALLKGLEQAAKLGAQDITVYSDSQLMVRQVTGSYKVKEPHLVPFVEEARQALSGFKQWTLIDVPREQNREADRLASSVF